MTPTDSDHLSATWPDFALIAVAAVASGAVPFLGRPDPIALGLLATAVLVLRLNLRLVEVLRRRRSRRLPEAR
jgi:hypothetical protein